MRKKGEKAGKKTHFEMDCYQHYILFNSYFDFNIETITTFLRLIQYYILTKLIFYVSIILDI